MTRPLLGKIGRTEGVRDMLSLLEDPCACFFNPFFDLVLPSRAAPNKYIWNDAQHIRVDSHRAKNRNFGKRHLQLQIFLPVKSLNSNTLRENRFDCG